MQTDELENWMGLSPANVHHQPLNRLAIPGSHNSFSYSIDYKSAVAPDSLPVYRVLNLVGGYCARHYISLWSKNQSKTFVEQLELGIRYFDLRVATRTEGSRRRLYFVHSLYAMSVESGLSSINSFLMLHPKEVVILDFNHFYAMELQDHLELKKLLRDAFEKRLAPLTPRAPSLHELWSKGQQVIVFYHRYFDPNDPIWPGDLCYSIWPNTPDPNRMIDTIERRRATLKPIPNFFYVCQGVLTPTTQTILSHLSKGVPHLAELANVPFLQWLESKQVGDGLRINIVIVDFIEWKEYVNNVLKLNISIPMDL